MSSIRPLITITILAVVGAWLYVKINEGPAVSPQGEPPAWQGEAAAGVPPLTGSGGAASEWPAGATSLPPVAAANPSATVPALPSAPATASNGVASGLPEMPAIPELPAVEPKMEDAPPAAAAPITPAALPVSIPQSRYPDQAAGSAPTGLPSDSTANVAALNPSDPSVATVASVTPPVAPPAVDVHEDISAAASGMARVGLTPQGAPSAQSAPPSNGSETGADVSAAQPAVDASISPVEPTFAAAWPGIQAALDRGELARALELLSKWHGESSLTPAEAEQVNTLLGQLAGTVVYSNEHQLEPARVVRPGETLDSIATECNVPWQLLAKINGIPAVDAVQPGQQLKVVRGPFAAVVDLDRSQLTLMLDGRYAGTFPITVPTGAAVSEGEWLVEQKQVMPMAGGVQSTYAAAQSTVDRAIVLRGEDVATGRPAADGPTLTIATAATPAGPANSAPEIRLSPQDAEELSDILSVGSRIVIRR
jgi:LysM repeat protein